MKRRPIPNINHTLHTRISDMYFTGMFIHSGTGTGHYVRPAVPLSCLPRLRRVWLRGEAAGVSCTTAARKQHLLRSFLLSTERADFPETRTRGRRPAVRRWCPPAPLGVAAPPPLRPALEPAPPTILRAEPEGLGAHPRSPPFRALCRLQRPAALEASLRRTLLLLWDGTQDHNLRDDHMSAGGRRPALASLQQHLPQNPVLQ